MFFKLQTNTNLLEKFNVIRCQPEKHNNKLKAYKYLTKIQMSLNKLPQICFKKLFADYFHFNTVLIAVLYNYLTHESQLYILAHNMFPPGKKNLTFYMCKLFINSSLKTSEIALHF